MAKEAGKAMNKITIPVLLASIILFSIAASADRSNATEETIIIDTDDAEIEGIYSENGKEVLVWIEAIEGVSGTSAHSIDVYIGTSDQWFDHFCGGEGNQFAEDFTPLYSKENLAISELPFSFSYTVTSDDTLYLILDNCDNQRRTDYSADTSSVQVSFAIDDESDELAEDIGNAVAGFGIMMILGGLVCCGGPLVIVILMLRKKKETVVVQQVPMQTQQPVMAPMGAPPMISGPDISVKGTVDANGYEWTEHNGQNYWRMAGSGSQWTKHQ